MQVLRPIKEPANFYGRIFLSRCSAERHPIGDSAILHPSVGTEYVQSEYVISGAYTSQPHRRGLQTFVPYKAS